MQLITLVERRHRVTTEEARQILWRRCVSLRVRLTFRLLGWFSPWREADLRRLLKGFALCESYEAAEGDMAFYQRQLDDRGRDLGALIFGYKPKRLLRVAKDYFGDAERAGAASPITTSEAIDLAARQTAAD